MISRKELRAIIKQHLIKKIPELTIDFLPDNWQDYRVLNGCVLIDYVGMQASEVSGRQQITRTGINLYLCLRNQFHSEQQLEILDKVRKAMTNDIVVQGMPFVFQGDQKLGEDDGIWYWQLSFTLNGILYQGE